MKAVTAKKNDYNQIVDVWVKRVGVVTLGFIIYNVVMVFVN